MSEALWHDARRLISDREEDLVVAEEFSPAPPLTQERALLDACAAMPPAYVALQAERAVAAAAQVVNSASFKWVRGKVYRLAPGDYGPLVFATAEDGTKPVEIRGGPGVHVQKATITQSRLVLRDLDVYNTAPASSRVWMLDVAAGVHDLLFDTVQVHRPTRFCFGRGVYATRGGNHHILFKSCWVHNMAGPFYYGIGDSDVTIDGGVYENNCSTPAEHSEGIDLNGTKNLVIKNARFWNVEGTSFVVALHHGGASWKIFNCVFGMDLGSTYAVGHGTVADNTTADAATEDVQVHHNTFVNLGSAGGRSGITFWRPKNVVARNNLFYACTKLAMLGVDHDYSATHDCPPSREYAPAAHDVSGTGNPFADAEFRLLEARKLDGVPLAAEFGMDRHGRTRTRWTRGACE